MQLDHKDLIKKKKKEKNKTQKQNTQEMTTKLLVLGNKSFLAEPREQLLHLRQNAGCMKGGREGF